MRGTWVLVALVACGDPEARPDAAMMVDEGVPPDELVIDAPDPNMPATLADTGLCVDAACTQIASGIHPYTPRFELWSDSSTKKRWIYLPAGAQIDTSNMDHWSFPLGTKLWKEFTRGGVRVETRLVMRVGDAGTKDDWFYAAYVWNEAQDATSWAEFGEPDANGTEHDVPSKFQCRECHDKNAPSYVLGFAALQLDFDGASGDIDLADAIGNGWLSAPPTTPASGPHFPFPVDDTSYEYPALGYMHANCGHCHNPNGVIATAMHLRLTVGTLDTLSSTPPYQTAVNVTTPSTVNGHTKIVDPGSPDTSVMIDRFESDNTSLKMPLIGTELVDPTGKTILRDWITNIP